MEVIKRIYLYLEDIVANFSFGMNKLDSSRKIS